jgi:ankyrin repeat protein
MNNISIRAHLGDIGGVLSLLEEGIDPNMRDGLGDTPLISAVSIGCVDIVLLLLEYKADVNLVNDVNWTALMWSSINGDMQTTKILLDSGADPNIMDEDGQTALSLVAIEEGDHMDIIFLLLDYGSSPYLGHQELDCIHRQSQNRENVRRLMGRYPRSLYQRKDRPKAYMEDYHDIAIMISGK